jgi:hypothetical protein
MKQIVAFVAALYVAFAPIAAFAQFPAPTDGHPAVPQGAIGTWVKEGNGYKPIETPTELKGSTAAVGGPVGSPVFVTPPNKSGGIIDIGKLFGDVAEPYINAIIEALIVAGVGWVTKRIHDKTGIEIDAKNRDALTTFLQNEAGALMAKGAVRIEGKTVHVQSEALAAAANNASNVIPDAAKHFGLTPDYVADRIVAQIPQIAAGAQIMAQHAAADIKQQLP